jgi:hypothetical protein
MSLGRAENCHVEEFIFFAANLVNSCLSSLPQLISALDITMVTISKTPAFILKNVRASYDFQIKQRLFFPTPRLPQIKQRLFSPTPRLPQIKQRLFSPTPRLPQIKQRLFSPTPRLPQCRLRVFAMRYKLKF